MVVFEFGFLKLPKKKKKLLQASRRSSCEQCKTLYTFNKLNLVFHAIR